jgi:alpha-mannosidase II
MFIFVRFPSLPQMIWRRRQPFSKLPMQARFYPMPGAAFLQGDHHLRRVSLFGRQALGVASLRPGQLEVVLDRPLGQDDDLGAGQVSFLFLFLKFFFGY